MPTYTIPDTDLLLDISSSEERKYVFKFRDLPLNARPRERMRKAGPGSLSVAELLAIVIGSGTKKEDVLAMSQKVVKEYGEKLLLRRVDADTLSEELDIPITKALIIVAVGELGRRFYDKNTDGMAVIRTPQQAYAYLRDMHNLPKECVRGIYLNTHHQVIHDEVISIGTVNSNLIHPREVFRAAIQHGAAGVILAHNHPSGNVEPSESDISITKQLVDAGRILGITLIDHIVVSGEKFKSVEVKYE